MNNTCIASYLENTYQFERNAIILAFNRDEKGYYFVLDNTIFHPQGGGQPADEGEIKIEERHIPIIGVKKVEREIRHYTNQFYDDLVGKKVTCGILPEKRLLHAKLHSGGHFISNVLEEYYPHYKAVKGHHFPNECYVEFMSSDLNPKPVEIVLLNEKMAYYVDKNLPVEGMMASNEQLKEIANKLPYSIPDNESIRIVRIGHFSYQPCSGTHIRNTSELAGLKISKSKIKGNRLKIYYDLTTD